MKKKTVFPVGHKTHIYGTALLMSLVVLLVFNNPADAQIYKYKDKDGVWVYTDSPDNLPKEGVKEIDSVGRTTPSAVAGIDIKKQLVDKLKPANPIEEASISVVSVKTPIGSGTGFFVSPSGYIVTNKHVLRLTRDQTEKRNTFKERVEGQAGNIQKELDLEAQKLELFKKRLDEYEDYIKTLTEQDDIAYARQNHAIESERYRSWLADFEKRKQAFEKDLKEYEEQMQSAEYNETLSYLKRSFTIRLADNSQHDAQLVMVSDRYDLALLKLDGFQTPYLLFEDPYGVSKGQPVFAIGNPANLQNSASAGIMSGREGIFVKTDAKIYPGNSGGPLVSEAGKVIGVNTFKQLTHKFEGLGFAISTQIIRSEFGSYLAQ